MVPQLKLPKRKTKIVCTLGPAVGDKEGIRRLIDAGMDMVRINCSHGDSDQRRNWVRLVRETAAEAGSFLPIMFDLQGPKIRLGNLERDLDLEAGQKIIIAVGRGMGNESLVYTSYEHFADDLKPGERVLIDDGKICLGVDHVEAGKVYCTVIVPGLLKPRKGINLPETSISAPSLNEKDLEDLKLAIEEQVDFVAVSFVRSADDMVRVRREAKRIGNHHLRFISKIERPEALRDLIPIINTSDGVMVARGDLGVEIGSHRVPMLQKEIIMRANLAGRFVITATQMLDSMMERPVPTRAEASDVANAILDGTDACMLSGETASGLYPIEAVEMMDKIAIESESHAIYRYRTPPFPKGSLHQIPDGISQAAHRTAEIMGAKLLVAFTNSGGSALNLSKKHPDQFIVGATIHENVARRMRAYWGVVPMLIEEPGSVEGMFNDVQQRIQDRGLARAGDLVILTAGFPLWSSGSTNLMKVMEIGEKLTMDSLPR